MKRGHQGEGGGKYKSTEELTEKIFGTDISKETETEEIKIQNYYQGSFFGDCDAKKVKPDKAGLRLWLGIDKSTYSRYKNNPKFATPIKRAEDLIEKAWVQRLDGMAATGAIFYLKNAFKDDYRDRTETEMNVRMVKPILGGLSKKKG